VAFVVQRGEIDAVVRSLSARWAAVSPGHRLAGQGYRRGPVDIAADIGVEVLADSWVQVVALRRADLAGALDSLVVGNLVVGKSAVGSWVGCHDFVAHTQCAAHYRAL
jgi:hypothetical protein